jgi:hypothetical protein
LRAVLAQPARDGVDDLEHGVEDIADRHHAERADDEE